MDADSISSRISPSCPPETQAILTAAWSHDHKLVNKLIDTPGVPSAQDPVTLESPLHAAIRSLGPPPPPDASEEERAEDAQAVEEAVKTIQELFLWGAIWNDVDDRDETPGCLAARLGREEIYTLCVQAGVRAELLFGVLGGYEELDSDDEEDDVDENGHVEVEADDTHDGAPVDGDDAPELIELPAEEEKKDVNSEDYLKSKVTYTPGKLVDDDGNGVMMAWETEIMRKSVDALLPGLSPGKRVLNIGFGMGIIDGMFAETKPSRHHIIEAHPEVLGYISSNEECEFGPAWEEAAGTEGANKVFGGRWQDICPELLARGEVYDAIYFDTFGEDYDQLKMFFTEFIPGLLDSEGIFGFFNGLGADRKICYDVYTRVAEMHLADAGLDVEWETVDVDLKGLEEAGKGEWEGVRRRYWTLDRYQLPVCTFLG